MKKILSIFLIGSMMASCLSPIEENESMGSLIAASDIDIEVTGITPGSNRIILKNNTPGVGAFWDYIVGTSARQCDTILMPFLGTQTITFTALSGGGHVKATKDVTVEKIDSPLNPLWNMLAGTDENGKTWVWATGHPNGGNLWGNGWDDEGAPMQWTTLSPEQMGELGFLYDEIVFDLNGGPNFTLIRKGVNGNESREIKDNFVLDVNKQTIKTSKGTDFIYPDTNPLAKGDLMIFKINENEMTLAYKIVHSWGDEYFFFMFKRKGYEYK